MNNETEQIYIINVGQSEPSPLTQKVLEVELSGNNQASLENVEDFSNVCRTCATITEFVIPIFEGEGLQNHLAEKIHKHLPIQVSSGDVLPRVVCYQCASTLLAWHELVQCCRQADQALRARAQRGLQGPKNIDPTPNSNGKEDLQNKSFYTNVKHALIDYFDDAFDEDNLDVEFVCQKCVGKPALTTVLSLAEHLQHDHAEDVRDAGAVGSFITEHVTFEQMLADDSDRETQTGEKEKAPMMLPSLFCPFCASVFSSPTRLVHHLNKHVEVSLQDGVVCCDTEYRQTRAFVGHLQQEHVRGAEGGARLVCVSCGLTADHVAELRAHYRAAHAERRPGRKAPGPNNQKYVPAACPACHKTFSNKYNMRAHLRGHAGAASFACDKCSKTYRNRGNLNTHKKLAHEGILKFLCFECGEPFPTRSARDVHARLHSGDTPYKCDHCDKSYRAKNTLARHVETHLDIRKYECEICSKKFRKKSHLDYHVKTHRK